MSYTVASNFSNHACIYAVTNAWDFTTIYNYW